MFKPNTSLGNLLFALLAFSLLVAACSPASAANQPPTAVSEATPTLLPGPEPTETQPPIVSHPKAEGGYVDLVYALTKGGAIVELGDTFEQAFFGVPARVIKVNGIDVQVFEYDDEAAREAESLQITPDGQPNPTMMVTWVDQPNFWAKGRIIVLYVGKDTDLIARLTDVLGEPITQPASSSGSTGETTGAISGMLGFPSQFIPAVDVYAISTDGSKYYSVRTQANQADFFIESVEPGEYYMVAYDDNGQAGGWSQFVACGLLAACDDHSLIPVTAIAGETATGVEVRDWYAEPGTFPPKPGGVTLPPNPTAISTPSSQYPPGIVYTIGAGNGLWLIGADGEPQLLTEGQNSVLAPDQRRVLYDVDYAGDIWLGDLSTGESRNLTNTPDRVEAEFQWWPANSGLIVFNFRPAEEQGPGAGYLATINVDGTNYRVLDSEIGSISPAALSPDGQTIAYDRGGAPWLYRLNGGPEPISVASFGLSFKAAVYPQWSPDGQRLAWKVYGDEQGGWSGVAIFDFRQQTGNLLHRYLLLGGSELFAQLAWSPDGQWLAVVNQAEHTGGKVSLWVMRPDGSEEYPLGAVTSPVWGPDSRQLVFWQSQGGSYLEAKVMLVEIREWQSRDLELPAGAQVEDWVTLQP